MQPLPHVRRLPVAKSPSARDTAREAVAFGQGVPTDAFFQDVHDARGGGTCACELPAALGVGYDGHAWLNEVPKAIKDEDFDHRAT